MEEDETALDDVLVEFGDTVGEEKAVKNDVELARPRPLAWCSEAPGPSGSGLTGLCVCALYACDVGECGGLADGACWLMGGCR